jgi:hypothetical protein
MRRFDCRRRVFNRGQGMNEFRRKADAAYGKILDGPLRLGAVVSFLGDFYLAHGILFNSVGWPDHVRLLFSVVGHFIAAKGAKLWEVLEQVLCKKMVYTIFDGVISPDNSVRHEGATAFKVQRFNSLWTLNLEL